MTDKAEFERLLDVYGFRCERFGQDLSTHARAQVVSAFAALASAPVAELRLEWSAKALYDAIKDVLLNHRLSNLVDEDGEFFPLVDHLCSQDDQTTESGEFEIALICDAIYNDVLTKSAPVADERAAVAYLDLGAGGYMDVGTDLTDEQLAALPKGRHMLAIIGTHGVDGYTPASAPVAGEAVYTLRVRGAIQAWTPTAAAFSIPDGEHQLFLSPAAPQASAEDVRNAALEALEAAQRFIRNGIELGYIRMPDADTPDPAHRTPDLIDAAIRALKQPQADKGGGQQCAGDELTHLRAEIQRLRNGVDQDMAEVGRLQALYDSEWRKRQKLRAAFDHPVFAFLLGEGQLHGVDFGERAPGAVGKWWWRKDLRAALSTTQAEQGERDA